MPHHLVDALLLSLALDQVAGIRLVVIEYQVTCIILAMVVRQVACIKLAVAEYQVACIIPAIVVHHVTSCIKLIKVTHSALYLIAIANLLVIQPQMAHSNFPYP